MNEQIPQSNARTTQFADGLPRRRWTVAEFEELAVMGVFDGNGIEGERLELLGGEVVPMSPKGARHETVKAKLLHYWYLNRVRSVLIVQETPLTLGDKSQPQPDMIVISPDTELSNLAPHDVHLVVEIADTSLTKDTRYKAEIYAAAGVRDYWVINVETLVTTVFRDPTDAGYRSRTEVPSDQTLTPLAAPELAIALDELGIR